VPSAGPVLDLSRRADVAEVARRLQALTLASESSETDS
jgi:hypothetical protein